VGSRSYADHNATITLPIGEDILVIAFTNDGAHTDAINKKGGGAYTYRLCEAATSTSSAEVRVSF